MFYALSVIRHKFYVLVAGLRVGNIPLWRLLIHDWSKFRPREFVAYRRRFVLKNCGKEEWRIAVNHHYKGNPHHWEYWIHPDGTPLPMPLTYVREMVADWMAASRSYAGHWDFFPWVQEHWSQMRLHNQTQKKVREVLLELGHEL